eukprot:symbB.v1.2.012970.t1/scaffold908.1/size153097/3
MLCFEIRRYFMLCFDRDFLASTPSRRDMWRLLLPLPGVFALIADRGNHELMFMDVGGAQFNWELMEIAMAELPPAIEQADFLDIALRFSLACDCRSFRPDNADKFDPQWHLEVALQNVIEEPERTRLLQCLLGRDDLALQPSEDLQRRFFRAVGRQLHTFESWTMFHLQELMHWDGGMKRLKEGITSWTIPTLRCQMLPRKILLEPLLLAKKWGLHFENLAGKLPGSIWSCISSFLMPPSFSWFEAPKIRHAHPWWDWLRHPLVFPLFSSDSTSRNTFGKSVVGISMFLGEGSAEECMHRQQLVSLTLNDVRFIKQNASRKQLWDRLMMIVGNKVPTEEGRHVKPRHLPELSFADALLCLCIFMRLKHLGGIDGLRKSSHRFTS